MNCEIETSDDLCTFGLWYCQHAEEKLVPAQQPMADVEGFCTRLLDYKGPRLNIGWVGISHGNLFDDDVDKLVVQ